VSKVTNIWVSYNATRERVATGYISQDTWPYVKIGRNTVRTQKIRMVEAECWQLGSWFDDCTFSMTCGATAGTPRRPTSDCHQTEVLIRWCNPTTDRLAYTAFRGWKQSQEQYVQCSEDKGCRKYQDLKWTVCAVQDFSVSSLRNVKVLFLPMLPDIRNSVILLEGSYASPACRSYNTSINIRWRWAWSTSLKILTRGNRSTRRKACPSPSFSTINLK